MSKTELDIVLQMTVERISDLVLIDGGSQGLVEEMWEMTFGIHSVWLRDCASMNGPLLYRLDGVLGSMAYSSRLISTHSKSLLNASKFAASGRSEDNMSLVSRLHRM